MVSLAAPPYQYQLFIAGDLNAVMACIGIDQAHRAVFDKPGFLKVTERCPQSSRQAPGSRRIACEALTDLHIVTRMPWQTTRHRWYEFFPRL
jgi:hypothetical protein